jgi:hypothetical protein
VSLDVEETNEMWRWNMEREEEFTMQKVLIDESSKHN